VEGGKVVDAHISGGMFRGCVSDCTAYLRRMPHCTLDRFGHGSG
jgi:hypothetical protein